MATKIVTKNSSTASAVPTASDLVQGELAVNVADKRLFTEDNGGAIVELGVNPAAEITANAGIALPDSQKATFGASDDLQIYHDGSNSYIDEVGTGNLKIKSNGSFIDIQSNSTRINNAANNEIMATFVANGGVTLYHDNSTKLATTSTGIDVTGTATMDGLTSDGNVNISNGSVATGGDNYVYSYSGGSSGQVRSGIKLEGSTNTLEFYTAQNERMRIDSSGNVGIGTSDLPSSEAKLTLSGTGTSTAMYFGLYTDYNYIRSIRAANNVHHMTFGYKYSGGSDVERMRIDSSGNLLVSKSSSSFNTAGAEIRDSGVVIGTVDGAAGLIANRLTSDGTLIQLSKDGTTVGSIGTVDGDLLIHPSASGHKGLRFGNGYIAPTNNAGAIEDGIADLGLTTHRFKDLRLSGGVYLGGTGAANKLDDYEEGTWTGSPTAGASSVLTVTDEKYTKIGNQVTIACTINFSGASGVLNVAGLPFNCAPAGVGIAREDSVSGYLVYGRVLAGTTDIDLFSPGTSNASPFLTSAGGFRFTMTYLT